MRRVFSVLLCLFSAPVHAAGFSTVDPSVLAMGEGGTGTARTEDPAAAVYNPAAVGMQPGLRAAIGLAIAAPRIDASAALWSEATVSGVSTPPHAHLVWAGERWSAGASFSVPFGSRVFWPEAWQRRFEIQRARLEVKRLSAFAGVRFGPLVIAAGPFVDFGSLGIERAIDLIEAEGKAAIDTRATGAGAHAGVFFRALAELDFGLAYRSRSRLDLSGYADFDVPPELSRTAPDQRVKTRLTLPDRFAFGAAWRPLTGLELAFDLELVLWSTVQALDLDFADEDTRDIRQERKWRTTAAPRLGASYLALDWLRLRTGLFFDPSPAPGETLGPSSPDSNRIGVSAGASIAIPGGFYLDLAYQHLELLGNRQDREAGITFAGAIDLAGLAVRYEL